MSDPISTSTTTNKSPKRSFVSLLSPSESTLVNDVNKKQKVVCTCVFSTEQCNVVEEACQVCIQSIKCNINEMVPKMFPALATRFQAVNIHVEHKPPAPTAFVSKLLSKLNTTEKQKVENFLKLHNDTFQDMVGYEMTNDALRIWTERSVYCIIKSAVIHIARHPPTTPIILSNNNNK